MAQMTPTQIAAAAQKEYDSAKSVDTITEAQDAIRTIARLCYHLAKLLEAKPK